MGSSGMPSPEGGHQVCTAPNREQLSLVAAKEESRQLLVVNSTQCPTPNPPINDLVIVADVSVWAYLVWVEYDIVKSVITMDNH